MSADQIVGGLVAYIKCSGHYYTDSGDSRPNGDHIWTDSGTSPPSPPTSSSGASPRAHKGWAALRKNLTHKWPATLQASEKQTAAALRALGRSRKVKL